MTRSQIHTMQSSRVLVVAVTLLSVAAFAADSTEFEAHRMIQYDRGNAAFGSRKTYVGALAGTLKSSSLEKKVAMLHMDEVTDELIDQIINGSLATAVLIILPEDMLALDDSAIALWRGFERKLLLSSTPIPVYFAFKGSEVAEIYDRVAAAGSTSDGYQLMVSNPEAHPISPVHAVNIQGWLPGVGADHGAAADHLPTLAIVAHYDTFGVAPSLAVGADDNASGVVALLELARLFSKLYRRLHTQVLQLPPSLQNTPSLPLSAIVSVLLLLSLLIAVSLYAPFIENCYFCIIESLSEPLQLTGWSDCPGQVQLGFRAHRCRPPQLLRN